MALNPQQIVLQIAERLREISTRQGNVPFWRGDLRKSHVVEPVGPDAAILSANTPYARAVHDGRSAITIKPRRGKALKWAGSDGPLFAKQVHQPARKGNPWLARAVAELQAEGLGFLAPQIGQDVADDLTRALRAKGLNVTSGKS